MRDTDSKIIDYPAMTNDEFQSACTTLESLCHDNLDQTEWARVGFHKQYLDIVKIIRVIPIPGEAAETPFEHTHNTNEDQVLMQRRDQAEWEENARSDSHLHEAKVVYSLVHSPSYQVPVLWIHTFDLPASAPTGLETLYKNLVPTTPVSALHGVGVMGGLSFGVSHCCADRRMAYILADTSAYGPCRVLCPSM